MQTHTIDDLARMVPNGAKLALPVDYAGVSMVMTRPLIARGLRDLHVVCLPTGGMQPDMLIGAGLVRVIETNVGRDLQYIRFNGMLVGGLAGLVLHTIELLFLR